MTDIHYLVFHYLVFHAFLACGFGAMWWIDEDGPRGVRVVMFVMMVLNAAAAYRLSTIIL